MQKVKDHQHLQRDSFSKAIINTDLAALKEHKAKKRMVESVSENSERITKLENDITDIKSLLITLINKK
jgi:hypothetical protein